MNPFDAVAKTDPTPAETQRPYQQRAERPTTLAAPGIPGYGAGEATTDTIGKAGIPLLLSRRAADTPEPGTQPADDKGRHTHKRTDGTELDDAPNKKEKSKKPWARRLA